MAKDYAKKSKNKKSASRSRSNSPRPPQTSKSTPWAWLVCGLLIGLFVAGLFYIKDLKDRQPITSADTLTKHRVVTKKSLPHNASASTKEENYDFYTILPEMKAWAPNHEVTADENTQTNTHNNPTQNLKSSPKQANKETIHLPAKTQLHASEKQTQNSSLEFVLQIAAFKQLNDADKLKAQLLLQGFNTSIKSLNNNGKSWYRVLIGPYSNQNAAIKTKQRLAENHIKSWLVKMPLGAGPNK